MKYVITIALLLCLFSGQSVADQFAIDKRAMSRAIQRNDVGKADALLRNGYIDLTDPSYMSLIGTHLRRDILFLFIDHNVDFYLVPDDLYPNLAAAVWFRIQSKAGESDSEDIALNLLVHGPYPWTTLIAQEGSDSYLLPSILDDCSNPHSTWRQNASEMVRMLLITAGHDSAKFDKQEETIEYSDGEGNTWIEDSGYDPDVAVEALERYRAILNEPNGVGGMTALQRFETTVDRWPQRCRPEWRRLQHYLETGEVKETYDFE